MFNQQRPTKLYLYLGRLDRKGATVIAVFNGLAKTTRVNDLSLLGLDAATTAKIEGIVRSNRMTHELWIEPAESFMELGQKLRGRGYSKLPLASTPMMDINQGTVKTDLLPHQKVMTKRKR